MPVKQALQVPGTCPGTIQTRDRDVFGDLPAGESETAAIVIPAAAGARSRPLASIAADIVREAWKTIPRGARSDLLAMADLTDISNDREFEIVASVRRSLNSWRSLTARRVKPELETILSHYRADRWP